jgi:hypothetical protein
MEKLALLRGPLNVGNCILWNNELTHWAKLDVVEPSTRTIETRPFPVMMTSTSACDDLVQPLSCPPYLRITLSI